MPEYPDVELYRSAIATRISGCGLRSFRLAAPHLLRSVDPAPESLVGRAATGVGRVGKRIVVKFSGGAFCAVHLAVAGRLHWDEGDALKRPPKLSPRGNLAVWEFAEAAPREKADAGGEARLRGRLRLVERSKKKRATIVFGAGADALAALDPGGLELPGSTPAAFRARLAGCAATIKRALTEPARFSGIGNAYSDEILHRARLSPTRPAGRLTEAETERLHDAATSVLTEWRERLEREAGGRFPTGVTAFREGFAAHGRFGLPCPDCGTPVARVVRAENEFNYCPKCQTGGRLLADRLRSRLLKKTWPRRIE